MNTITRQAYEGDIVSRLRNWRGLHLSHSGALFEEAAGEIEKLRSRVRFADAVIRSSDAAALTTEEQRAIEEAADFIDKNSCASPVVLRSLLARLGDRKRGES